ncbi:MAG: YfhO family protein [Bacteroidetes bacterium]|nr:YfhO family protein [Bacteroidota bacterium]
MNSGFFKKATPHLIALAVIFGVIFLYFNPLLGGKVLKQYDVLQWKATFQEIANFEKTSGERTFWTNSIFGGMPTYLIGATYFGNFTANILFYISDILKNPADTLFLLFICFYLLLLTFEVKPWLAIAGSLAFALSSFNFINIDAGHITKGNAIAFIPLVLAGINYTLRKDRLLGAILTGIAVSFELAAGHLQITYYLLFIILAWMVVEFIQHLQEKKLASFLISGVFLLVAAGVGIGTHITGLLTTEEYGKYSIRSASELTKTPDGQSNEANSTSGLDKDYAMAWSNGVMEPMTILIPNFYGGASNGELGTNTETYKKLKEYGVPDAKNVIKQMPIYWGDQPFTAGPIYYGAIVVFLFVFGMFYLKGMTKWWIFTAAMLAIFLSMGKNFTLLSDLFFDYFPLYNKFRSVTFILCVSQTMFPLLAVLALKDLIDQPFDKKRFNKSLQYSLAITGGLSLLFMLVPGAFFDFTSAADQRLPEWLREPLALDRASLLRTDAFRSLALILAAAGLIWAAFNNKFKKEFLAPALALLIVIDLWAVDKRYLNDSDFEKKKADAAIAKSPVDEQILADPDPHYRVYNNTTDFDKDALTAYYHKTIGGYHGAKMRRFQELIEWHLSRQNMEAYNMLNVKYFIVGDSTGRQFAQRNPFNNGNAWFVSEIKWVNNADEEIAALNGFKSLQTAIVDKKKFEAVLKGFTPSAPDSSNKISLTTYQPNKLVYAYESNSPQLTVFSEVYYDKGWNAYIDGKLVEHLRADYILRALPVPAGKHQIEFRFEPKTVETGEKIAYASSGILYGSLLIALALGFIRKKKE